MFVYDIIIVKKSVIYIGLDSIIYCKMSSSLQFYILVIILYRFFFFNSLTEILHFTLRLFIHTQNIFIFV